MNPFSRLFSLYLAGPLATFGDSHHTKEISSIALRRHHLASASVDRTCRVWDLRPLLSGGAGARNVTDEATTSSNLLEVDSTSPTNSPVQHLHCYQHDAAVSHCAFSDDTGLLATALSDGRWAVRAPKSSSTQKDGNTHTQQSLSKKRQNLNKLAAGQALTARYYKRGAQFEPAKTDPTTTTVDFKKRKLTPVDAFLKDFQYAAALEAAVSDPQLPLQNTLSLLDELAVRNAIEQAVNNIPTAAGVKKVLAWLLRAFGQVNDCASFQKLVVRLAEALLERVEGGLLLGSEGGAGNVDGGTRNAAFLDKDLLDKLSQLTAKIGIEVTLHKKIVAPMLGMMDPILSVGLGKL